MSRTISSGTTGPVILGAADNPLSITGTAASSSQGAAGTSLTALVSSEQAWLGGVNAFLTKPPG